MGNQAFQGVGLGLRKAMLKTLQQNPAPQIDFLEVAPENWLHIGGDRLERWQYFTQHYPIVCHGLSLSLGSPAPLDEVFVRDLKAFFDQYNVAYYSEHLSYCSDEQGHLYDLMPIPFTPSAVTYVADRIKRVQDILERRIAIENVSYYAAPEPKMREIEFLTAVLETADCDLLLDVNNIYVNSINHQYDAEDFLKQMPGDRIAYLHIAGHYEEAEDIRIDTHGTDVIEPVWDLLAKTYALFGLKPTLLERDNRIPPLPELLKEVDRIHVIQQAYLKQNEVVGVR